MSTTETAIVTGASQGIGAGLVTRFLEKGYNVVGNSRAVSASTNLTPSRRLALVDGDIGDSATAQKITDTAIARFGRIDVLVNNAGLLVSKPFIDYTPGDFDALVSTILAGFFYISQSAARQMLRPAVWAYRKYFNLCGRSADRRRSVCITGVDQRWIARGHPRTRN
jgi:NAD(P)-dependent dehydrogenase (short-subunit alcohol dehydrogenase family)